MLNVVKAQRDEIVRLNDENATLRNVCLKLTNATEDYRRTIKIMKIISKSLHGWLYFADLAYEIIRGEG